MKCLHFWFCVAATWQMACCFDYCSLSTGHTMCKYTGVDAACGSEYANKAPNPSEIDVILTWHNDRRQTAASGNENKPVDGPLQKSKNMHKMFWDPELAAIAQRLADQCSFKHDCSSCRSVQDGRFTVGQNIAMASYTGHTPALNWPNMLNGWYTGEVDLFKKSYVSKYVFGDWGHYSQIIWWNTRAVGCGAVSFRKGSYTTHLSVCNYGAAGNIQGARVYQEGPSCTGCPSGMKCDITYNALCAP